MRVKYCHCHWGRDYLQGRDVIKGEYPLLFVTIQYHNITGWLQNDFYWINVDYCSSSSHPVSKKGSSLICYGCEA